MLMTQLVYYVTLLLNERYAKGYLRRHKRTIISLVMAIYAVYTVAVIQFANIPRISLTLTAANTFVILLAIYMVYIKELHHFTLGRYLD
jgi:hypothetical protein